MGRSRNVNSVGADQFRIRHLGLNFHSLHSCLFLRLSDKAQQVLMVYLARYVLEIGDERDWRSGTN